MIENLSAKEISKILEQRADKAARVVRHSDDEKIYSHVAVIGVGRARFGIPLEKLCLITNIPPIAILPQMSTIIRGLVQIRGELIGVIDVARWFGIPDSVSEHLAVVEETPGKLGLLVDKVLGFRGISFRELAAGLDDDTQDTGHPIDNTTKDLITLLDITRLFSCSAVTADFSRQKT